MSYAQQIADQGAQASDLRNQLIGRGQQKIADYDRDMQMYMGDEIAHRNGLSQLKTESEGPRLLEEYMGVKPFAKKLAAGVAGRTGLTKFLQDKFSGTKVEALQNNLKEGLAAAKEGRYGDLLDGITGGKGAVGGVEQFATNALTKAKSIVGDSSLPSEDARAAMNSWIKRSVGGRPAEDVRQIGGARFQSLSPEERANVAKGSVDEDEIPFRPEELARADVYKGLTTGRFRVGRGGSLSDTATGSTFKATTGDELPGGVRLRQTGNQFSLEGESGEAYDASRAFGGDPELNAYRAATDANDTSRSFQGSAETQSRLDRLFRGPDRSGVDLTSRGARPVEPDVAGPAEESAAADIPELASPAQMALLRRGPQPVTRSSRSVSVGQNPDGTAAERAERAAGKRPVNRPVEPEPEQGANEPIGDFVNRLSLRQPDTLEDSSGRGFSRDTPLSERPSGPYGSGRDAGTDRFRQEPGLREPVEEQELGGASRAFEPGSFASRNESELSSINRGYVSRSAPESAAPSSMRGQYSKPTDSGRSATTDDTPLSEAPRPAFKAGETFAKDVGKAEVEAAPVEEAEASLPGVGEALMGLTALGGVIKGAIAEHREKKEMDAEQITKPQAPQQAGGPVSGVGFDSAPVIDSDDYHHL